MNKNIMVLETKTIDRLETVCKVDNEKCLKVRN